MDGGGGGAALAGARCSMAGRALLNGRLPWGRLSLAIFRLSGTVLRGRLSLAIFRLSGTVLRGRLSLAIFRLRGTVLRGRLSLAIFRLSSSGSAAARDSRTVPYGSGAAPRSRGRVPGH